MNVYNTVETKKPKPRMNLPYGCAERRKRSKAKSDGSSGDIGDASYTHEYRRIL